MAELFYNPIFFSLKVRGHPGLWKIDYVRNYRVSGFQRQKINGDGNPKCGPGFPTGNLRKCYARRDAVYNWKAPILIFKLAPPNFCVELNSTLNAVVFEMLYPLLYSLYIFGNPKSPRETECLGLDIRKKTGILMSQQALLFGTFPDLSHIKLRMVKQVNVSVALTSSC